VVRRFAKQVEFKAAAFETLTSCTSTAYLFILANLSKYDWAMNMEVTPSEIIRIMLVDDHRAIHELITQLMLSADDMEIVAQGHNGLDALSLCEATYPDVIIMDVVMPNMDGVEATRRIHEKYPAIKILVLSAYQDDDSVRIMLKNGAAGYILKNSLAQELLNTVRATFRGKAVFSQEVADALVNPSAVQKHFGLTHREEEILKLVARGMSNNEIAEALFIGRSTVQFHVTNILLKLHVETRSEAIVLAVKNNLI
jgi:NarL family two-component system response regulator LiaR